MKLKFLLPFILFFSFNSALSQWVSNGPFGGSTKSLYYYNGVVYTGLHKIPFGIYSSNDSGMTWSRMGDLISDVTGMLKSGITFYAIGTTNSVYRTTDNGTNWRFSTVGTGSNLTRSIAALGTDIFVATQEGVFKSADTGATWVNVSPLCFTNLISIGSTLVAAECSDGIYVSKDGGNVWTNKAPGRAAFLRYNTGSIIYATNRVSPFDVHVSTDSGNTWNNYGSGLPANPQPAGFTQIGNKTFALVTSKVYSSLDTGKSWTLASTIIPTTYFSTIITDGSNLFACNNNNNDLTGGVYKSSDLGLSWKHTGLNIFKVSALSAKDSSVYFGGDILFGNSMDSGITWSTLSAGLLPIKKIYFSDTGIFLCTTSRLYRSLDNGKTFTVSWNSQAFDIIKINSKLYLTTFSDIYTSTNGGTSWTSIPKMYNKRAGQLASLNNYIFAASRSMFDSSYYSTDGGVNWTSFKDTTFVQVTAMFVLGNTIFAGNAFGIIKSSDYGATWTYCNNGLNGASVSKFMYHNGKLMAANSKGSFISSDSGATWNGSLNQGLTQAGQIYDMVVQGRYLYAAPVTGGIWRRDISNLSTAGIINTAEVKDIHELQNYPNPFNSFTRMKYELGKGGQVKIKIYDVHGKQISMLINEYQEAGKHLVEFNGDMLPGGIYYYQIESGLQMETKKMILVR